MKDENEIELKLKREVNKSLDDYVLVSCNIPKDTHELAVLKELLGKVGITMSASHGSYSDMLSFRIDYETFDKVTSRGAGRKKDITMKNRYKECTVAELKEKLKTMKKSEIIEDLGCPSMTFYRILKNINLDDESDQDMSIWHFTS